MDRSHEHGKGADRLVRADASRRPRSPAGKRGRYHMPGEADASGEAGGCSTTNDIPLAEPARLTLTVRVVDVPPGGRVPEHHHGGPTIDYVMSGAVRMQLLGGPALVYQTGQTMFEPSGSVHLYADNVSLTEPAKIHRP